MHRCDDRDIVWKTLLTDKRLKNTYRVKIIHLKVFIIKVELLRKVIIYPLNKVGESLFDAMFSFLIRLKRSVEIGSSAKSFT